MHSGQIQQKLSKKPCEKLNILKKVSAHNSRRDSECTKSTSSSKNSPIPEIDVLCNHLPQLIVKEQSCDSEVSVIEDPAPLLITNIKSKEILTVIKQSINNPVKNSQHMCNWESMQKKVAKNAMRKICSKSLIKVKEKIKELKEQISELNIRATTCESELRLKEKENSEIKTILFSLREQAFSEPTVKDEGSVCKACILF
jgi:gas vesicle protein